MSKNRPKPAAALYFSGALSATPVGVHQKCRSANANPDYLADIAPEYAGTEQEDGNPVDFLWNTYGKCHTDD